VAARRWGCREIWQPPDPTFAMPGRTPAALLRLVEEWHREVNHRRIGPEARRPDVPARFRPSGLKAGRWTFGKDETRRVWTVQEIATYDALLLEGREMRHCVATYAWSIVSGQCSIWSVRFQRPGLRQPERALTVEVRHAARAVVQARGKCNRRPVGEEEQVLRLWAGVNGLVVALG
jgi:hypothetical protein